MFSLISRVRGREEERGREGEGERERKRNIYLLPTERADRNGAGNLCMCPEQESNPQPYGVWTALQPTVPPGQGLAYSF